LKELGWGVETVWQCELRDRRAISAKLDKFLSPTSICV
jgi:G:T-mismatch repair DNA endonuclease (very short patch repair protein)